MHLLFLFLTVVQATIIIINLLLLVGMYYAPTSTYIRYVVVGTYVCMYVLHADEFHTGRPYDQIR